MARRITLGRRERSPADDDSENEPRASWPRTAIPARLGDIVRIVIELHRTPGEVSTIKDEDAGQFDLEDLRPYEINESGLRTLGGKGIMRWVKWTLGNMTIAYARVVDKDHSPPRSFINAFEAIFRMARLGFSWAHHTRFSWEKASR